MIDLNKEIPSENLTQKDIVQLLLHNAQHMVTREELKTDVTKVETKIDKLEDKIIALATKEDISKVEDKISKIDAKFDKIQWLIFATMFTILFKDYIISFIQVIPK